jgi:hypothetical protein
MLTGQQKNMENELTRVANLMMNRRPSLEPATAQISSRQTIQIQPTTGFSKRNIIILTR